MRHLQNLHTHSTYCDGKNTLREIIDTAIEKGFESVGFSSHSHMPFSTADASSPQKLVDYKGKIAKLKEEYNGRIGIFCGIEFEMYSPPELEGFDYVIGSSHYFKIGNEYVPFDCKADVVQEVINNYFGGNGISYARAYYEQLATLPSFGSFDILGHFDLISKHCETNNFFDIESPLYLGYAYEAIEALRGKIPFFEVNTGAIARGYRTSPYPSIPLTKRLLECGFLPIISSDCHSAPMLDCAFEDAADLLCACGAKERYILTESGFCSVPLR